MDGDLKLAVIDDLEFSTGAPPAESDILPPTVEIIQPTSDATLTGEMFLLEAEITEHRRLSSVDVTIFHQPSNTTVNFSVSFFGGAPDYRFGPIFTGPLGIYPR